jgi:alkaline phosphatase D
MNIQPPTVGPIVGYTTFDHVRIWLRGDFQPTPDGYRRCFGVAQLRASGDDGFGPLQYVKLPPYFDMTGVCVFNQLKQETTYEYRAGWFFAETELEPLDLIEPSEIDWRDAFHGTFRTSTNNKSKSRVYVLGSCRYLLKLWGGWVYDERGDKTFESILRQIENSEGEEGKGPIDGLIMVGDQIYADDLNSFRPDTSIDQFLERYREVFSRPYLQQLMSQVPTYMVLDDHEIEDNWPSKATDEDRVVLYPAAMHSYQVYQCSHSPLFELNGDRITGTLDRFWYTFQDGCCDWFVTDSRTERIWDKDPGKRRMIKPSQMEALKIWLTMNPGLVKMVVTSVPFFPDLDDPDRDDKWTGFAAQRTEILDFILEKKISKVVFLSGDVHCSMCAELGATKDSDFKIASIISSSLFWPYPHMDPSGFDLAGPIASDSPNGYNVTQHSEVFSTDNFARMEVTPKGISVTFFERKGAKLDKTIDIAF